jgi:hypothetical protein
MRRTPLELPEESKPMVDLFMIHQLGKNITKLPNHSLKLNQRPHQKKPQMRAERSSSNTSRRPLLLSKLKTLLKLREPLKSPKWTLKTLRILSVRKPESLPEELP